MISLALSAGAVGVRAEDKRLSAQVPAISLRVGEHESFDRLAFDVPRGTTYKLSRSGESVTLSFSRRASVRNLASAARLKRVKSLDVAVDEKGVSPRSVVTFRVAQSAVVKDFLSGSTVVIDISGSEARAALPPVVEPAIPPKAEEEVKQPQEQPPATISKEEAPQLAERPIPPVEPVHAEGGTPTPSTVQLPVVETSEHAPPVQTASPAPVVPHPLPNTGARVPDVTHTTVAEPKVDIGLAPVLVAAFDPKVQVGAAIFARGGYGTILFDRKFSGEQAMLAEKGSSGLVLETLDLPKNTGFRFAMPRQAALQATRTGTVLKIFLVKKNLGMPISTGFVVQPDFALGARVLLPTMDAPDSIAYTDPVVGDDLVVLPIRETLAFSSPLRMADFQVIPAVQGLVVKPLHEKVTVRTYAEGVEISAEGGLKLSPSSDTGLTRHLLKKGPDKNVATFFDLAQWKGKPGEDFTTKRQQLSQTIIDVPEAQRNLARLELARFYFAYGMGEEALALLGALALQAPDMAQHPEFIALRGAANILTGHAQAGLRDLNVPFIAEKPEIILWQAVGATQMRDWKTAEEKFNYSEEIWNVYPEPFHSRFAVLAAESALSLDKDKEAQEWVGRLEKQAHLPDIDHAIKYLHGVLHSKAGRAEEAEKLWKEVTQSNDRLYKIRAELALIDLGVATRSLTPQQATERLEGLRFAWRGDDLELDILHRLGGFYFEAKNYKSGLSVLQQAVRLYPNSTLTPPIRAEMAKVFRDLYLTDVGKELSPVEALTMYQDYRDLIPQGEEGNELKRNLAERLVAIDLLDQAANLLDEQIKGGLTGEERMHVGARLAAIRLLDHKPDAALSALEGSKADVSDSAAVQTLRVERKLLHARALSEQSKYDQALALVHDDQGKSAKILRADVTMRAQRWADAAKALRDLVGEPPKAGEQLSEDQAQWLVNCAIALSLAGDNAGLDQLAIDYGPAMAGTTQKDMFSVLTRPDKATQLKDIAAAQAKVSEVDMFRGFLDTYRGKPEVDTKESKPSP